MSEPTVIVEGAGVLRGKEVTMPWIAPSHQAPALALKIWRPAAFSGLALVLGSVVPDLEFILRLDNDWIVSHTFAAQVYFTVPMVLLLHVLLTGLVLPFVGPLVPPGPPLFLEGLDALRPLRSTRDWATASVSAFIGGLTHVLLDGVTHGNHSGWALAFLPGLALPITHPFGSMPLHDLLHPALSLFLGVGALQAWQGLVREGRLWAWRGEEPRVLAAAPTAVWRRTLRFLVVASLTGALVAPALRSPDSFLGSLELALFGAIAFFLYGLVAAAAADRALRALPRRRLVRLRPVLALALGE
jgi:hypothetical protein